MFLSPYQTTPCKGYDILKIVHELATHQKIHFGDNTIFNARLDGQGEAVLSGSAGYSELSTEKVSLICSGANEIPPFGHPVIVTSKFNSWNSYVPLKDNRIHTDTTSLSVFADVRNFSKVTREGDLVATSNLDMNVAVARSIASLHWAWEGPYAFNTMGNFPMTVFARWLSDQLTRRFALSPEAQIKTTIITAFYFGCQFIIGNTLHEDDKLKIAGQISRCVHTSVESIMKIVDELDIITDVTEYIEALQTHGDSIRFEELNLALLYAIVGSSWFGFNKTENVAVAIEHVPTFMTLLYYATIERGYRNTILGQAAKQNAKADNDKQFCKSFMHILKN